jgi:hypothetical protein
MTSPAPDRAALLAECLDGHPADGDVELAALAELATGLSQLGAAVIPAPAFRGHLALALGAAPAPSSLVAVPVPTTEVVHQLDAGLEALRAGDGDLSALLAQHPASADELAPLLALAGALDELPGVPAPSTAFRRQLFAELAVAPEPSSLRARRVAAGGLFARLWRNTAFAAAMAAVVVMFLAFGASYASANSLPGQPLYPVKRALEIARLWALSGEAELSWRLDLAQRRLFEAVAVPAAADNSLGDFNREITAGLTLAERALASGTPRVRVVPTLIGRLVDARAELVTGEPVLPPIAWRSSLALVDTAIGLLQNDGLAHAVPILRLFGPARGGVAGAPRRGVLPLPAVAMIPPTPTVPVAGGGGSGGSGRGGGQPGGGSAPVPVLAMAAAPAAGSVGAVGQATPEPAGQAAPPAGPTSTVEPQPTLRPKQPTTEPTVRPSPTAVVTVVPTEPTQPPAPTSDPATATPSATPDKLPPVIKNIVPDIQEVPLGGRALLTVHAEDPDGGQLTYEWTSDWGEMLNERSPEATFHAVGNLSGLGLGVTVSVKVTDQTGMSAEDSIVIWVVPRAENGKP